MGVSVELEQQVIEVVSAEGIEPSTY
jgi:hypothetical protein